MGQDQQGRASLLHQDEQLDPCPTRGPGRRGGNRRVLRRSLARRATELRARSAHHPGARRGPPVRETSPTAEDGRRSTRTSRAASRRGPTRPVGLKLPTAPVAPSDNFATLAVVFSREHVVVVSSRRSRRIVSALHATSRVLSSPVDGNGWLGAGAIWDPVGTRRAGPTGPTVTPLDRKTAPGGPSPVLRRRSSRGTHR